MQHDYQCTAPGQTKMLPSPLAQRQNRNLNYLLSLQSQNLLRPYLFEAGLWGYSGSVGTTIGAAVSDGPETWHWGWESLTCELRGHILGHWLSAAAHLIVQTGHIELKAKAENIVAELARCQEANGGEWCGPFPEKFLHKIAAGNNVWAPHYTLHKILMGLFDMYAVVGNELALEILVRFARWFHRWTQDFTREQMDDILDFETGGMLEVWANLYGVTGEESHRELVYRYDRPRFFDRLLAGDDVLTNKHANTQIPEILGAARAYEVTGDERWRRIVEAFWKAAVSERGTYCTGGGSCGEIWQPPFSLSARLHAPHEHCTVYNMMRLAQYLFRWTGEAIYADYWERNFWNAILAQQHPESGMVTYFLPLGGGSIKKWGTPTGDFWCCHGTLMQAQSDYSRAMFLTSDDELVIGQYLPSQTKWNSLFSTAVEVTITQDTQHGLGIVGQRNTPAGNEAIQHLHHAPIPMHRPDVYIYEIRVACGEPKEFTLKLRLPWWVQGEAQVFVNGVPETADLADGFAALRRVWRDDRIRLVLPKTLTVEPLPDAPQTVAFIDGPLVLAGLTDEERTLHGDINDLKTVLRPDEERHHGWWLPGHYRTVNQERGLRFIPLCEVRDETYCVYFPVHIREGV